jgi:hypothetical protein
LPEAYHKKLKLSRDLNQAFPGAQPEPGRTAAVQFVPGIGTASYKAVFVGTKTYATSSSTSSSLTAEGSYSSSTTLAQMTLTNTTSSAVPIGSISLHNSSPAAFATSNTCGSSLAANSNCAIRLRFTPPATGSYSGGVYVTYSASEPPLAVSLSGTGVAGP